MTMEIQLSNGPIALVDDQDYHRVIESGYRWYAVKGRNGVQYALGQYKGNYIGMHRFILNAPRGYIVDHIDFNGLNNTRNNLRIANHQQSSAHRRTSKNKSRKYKNVHYNKNIGKYRAEISDLGKNIHLGYFASEEAAALAYNKAAIALYGDYAVLNDIEN